jgi:hypothetical protein
MIISFFYFDGKENWPGSKLLAKKVAGNELASKFFLDYTLLLVQYYYSIRYTVYRKSQCGKKTFRLAMLITQARSIRPKFARKFARKNLVE